MNSILRFNLLLVATMEPYFISKNLTCSLEQIVA